MGSLLACLFFIGGCGLFSSTIAALQRGILLAFPALFRSTHTSYVEDPLLRTPVCMYAVPGCLR